MTGCRMLAAGEIIREGDECCTGSIRGAQHWEPVKDSIGQPLQPENVGYWRRPWRAVEPQTIINTVRYQHEQIAETFRLIVAAGWTHAE